MSLSRIDSNSIAANAISAADLAESSITEAKIANSAITEAKISANAVVEAKIADSAVTPNKISGQVPVSKGGTGVASLTANAILVGNGTSAVSTILAGTTGNVLTSNGNTWISQAISAGGNYVLQAYTSPATWTKPDGLKAIKVTVIGGGGGGGRSTPTIASGGGGGGAAIRYLNAPDIPGPVSVTVGSGGTSSPNANGGAGGTSSFGPFASATGGAGGLQAPLGVIIAGVSGGVGSSGTINIQGSSSSPSFNDPDRITFVRSAGGPSILGGGGAAPPNGVSTGGVYGGGGGGNIAPQTAAGAAGIVIVEEFY